MLTDRRCGVAGCDQPYRSKGLCNAHYLRFRRYGDAEYPDQRPVPQPCSMDDCDRTATKRRLCEKHYKRWQVHGDPTVVAVVPTEVRSQAQLRRRPEIVDRFWANVQIGDDDECWLWTGSKVGRGYGVLFANLFPREKAYAHRLAILFDCRELPDDALACHHCDVPSCVNPRHLYVGDFLSNARDMRERGRARNANTGKTHCIRGHEFTDENTWRPPDGRNSRHCRTCLRLRREQYRSERRSA